MRKRIVPPAFSFAVALVSAAMLFASDGMAQETKTKILKYDKDGRVIGYDDGTVASPENGESGSGGTGGKTFNPDTSFEEGELIVINPPQGFASGIRSLGYSVVETINMRELKIVVQRLRIPADKSVPKALKELRQRYPRLEIDANHQFDPSAGVEFPNKIARALIRWDKAPETCGKGIRIGMIDSGVDITHPAFKGQNIVFKSFHKEGREPGPSDHGTAVAGIIAGRAEWGGLLPGASLYAANMFEINEEGRKVGNAIGLLKAANWLINEKVDVINLSVAGADNKVLKKIFDQALAKNMVMVAAAGNWGRSDKPAYPAAYNGVVAVTALSMEGLIYQKANTGKYIDFAAPGVSIYTAAPGGGGRLQSGTSFATPFITAMMSLEMAAGKGRTAAALDKALMSYVKDLGVPGRDNVFGWGFVRRPPKC